MILTAGPSELPKRLHRTWDFLSISRTVFAKSDYTGIVRFDAQAAEYPVNEQTLKPQPLSAEAKAEEPQISAQDIVKTSDETPQDFDFWRDLKESLPPWANELVGFALIVFGILSFISLYIASDALGPVTWADMLATLFGDGAVFVAAMLFAFGIVLWLPKVGIRIRINSARFLALEIAFLASLALLHLSHSDGELRALARAGQGGGLIGWGLSLPFFGLMGRHFALLFFAVVIAICLVIMVGLQRRHVVAFFTRYSGKLRRASETAQQAPTKSPKDDAQDLYLHMAESPGYRMTIMRIRPNRENIPSEAPESQQAASGPSPSVERVGPAKMPVGDSSIASVAATAKPPAVDLPPAVSSNKVANGQARATSKRRLRPRRNGKSNKMPLWSKQRASWTESLPSLDLLASIELVMPDVEEINHKAMLIQNTLLEFDLETTVIDVQVGPTVTRYALQPHKEDGTDRIRMSKIASYARDLSLALAAKRLRMETPVPGTNYMGIEVPNKEPAVVALRNVLESAEYAEHKGTNRNPLLIPLGRDVTGEPVSLDLSQMPHLLIAGATGAGKSVCMAAIATSLLMQYTPDQVQMVMLDPKMVELLRFNGIPHLLGPVEIEHERIIGVLRWCTREMERRYKLLERYGARNIKMYNEAQLARGKDSEPLPYIVILIDEIGDLMLSHPDETERAVTRLAQMARAVGMHMVIATQRPSVDVITGLIKANFPARIAFSVASSTDSRVILDRTGAEDLLGKGDMLFLSSDAAGPQRIQGCYVSEDDVRDLVDHWRDEQSKQVLTGAVLPRTSGPWESGLKRRQFLSQTDPMLEDALKLVVESGEASASLIQRRLGLGYPRAARIMDLLEELDVVGEETSAGRNRKVIIPPDQDPLKYILERHRKNMSNS